MRGRFESEERGSSGESAAAAAVVAAAAAAAFCAAIVWPKNELQSRLNLGGRLRIAQRTTRCWCWETRQHTSTMPVAYVTLVSLGSK